MKISNELLERIKNFLSDEQLEPCAATNSIAYSCSYGCSGSCDNSCNATCTSNCQSGQGGSGW